MFGSEYVNLQRNELMGFSRDIIDQSMLSNSLIVNYEHSPPIVRRTEMWIT